ncbi:MAG: thioesterase family protein [Anaerolineae bacterium]|nr:thioesterase family protein [Anaerolineae bacterium]
MFEKIHVGLTGERSIVVAEEHTAARWGSGGLDVFSTPYMIALMEGAAVAAVDPLLPEGYQSVGIRVEIDHLAPTPVGSKVVAHAELVEVDGRKLTFQVEARDEAGIIGRGVHQRFIIHAERFMAKARARREAER